MPQLRSFYDQDSFSEPDFVLRYNDRWKVKMVLEGRTGSQWVIGLLLTSARVDFTATEKPLTPSIQADIEWGASSVGLHSVLLPDRVQFCTADSDHTSLLAFQFLNHQKRPGFDGYVERFKAGQAVVRGEQRVLRVQEAWRDRDVQKGHIAHLFWMGEPGDDLDVYAGVLSLVFMRGAGV